MSHGPDATGAELIALEDRFAARTYAPLPVVLARGEGCFVWDVAGRRYLDGLSGYSALNQGHRHPRIVAALVLQAQRLTLTSRAFHNDRMGAFLERLCNVTGFPRAVPMNTGAEAVETAVKAVRKWGYDVRGVPADRATIVVAAGNFHGRTTTIVSFSTDDDARRGFGPYTPGFRVVPYGDAAAVAAALVGLLPERLIGIQVKAEKSCRRADGERGVGPNEHR